MTDDEKLITTCSWIYIEDIIGVMLDRASDLKDNQKATKSMKFKAV